MNKPSIELVREFHVTYGQPVLILPMIASDGLNAMRVALLQEELNELKTALGIPVTWLDHVRKFFGLLPRCKVGTLDALTDLQYVLDGAFLSLGFHRYKDAALAEVHRSNMSKLGEDGKPIYREDGNVLKGPNYTPPDLASVLANDPNTP